jgi:transketolase
MREAFGQALVELGRRNPDVVVLDADLAPATKTIYFAQAFPDRFIQVGIAEQNMVGIAAGLATLGFIPFTSTFACFATKRDTDQIRVMVAQPRLNVKITGAYGGILAGKTGKSHQSVQDLAIMRSMPNMTVVAPGDATEAAQAVEAIAEYEGPVYLRLARDPSPAICPVGYQFTLGRSVVLRQGTAVTLIGTGVESARVMAAADLLAAEGVQAHVLHVPTLKPLDIQGIVRAAARTGRVVTAEDHTIIGGLGSAVAEVLGEHCPLPMRRVGLNDCFAESAPDDLLLEKYGLTARHIASAAKALLAQ